MRILYYSPHPNLNLQSSSGYGTHMREMIGAFKSLGHEVLPVIQGGVESREESNGLARPSNPMKRVAKSLIPSIVWETLKDVALLRYDAQAEETLTKAIQSFKPDFIYERCNYLQVSGVNAAKNHGVPHILEVNAPLVEERRVFSSSRSLLQWKGARIEAEQLKKTSHVAVVSSALKKYLLEKHGLSDEKFLVTPNAVNPECISVDESNVQKIRDDYQLQDSIVIGFVGSIFRWHGVDILIKAFAQASKENAKIRLLIVGDGELFDELKQLAIDLEIGDKTTFAGKVPHERVFDFIQVMDICVMANSNWYGSPVKLFEYGAMKKAIIAPRNGPVQDVMVHEEDGLLVQAQESELAGAIQTLVKNPHNRISMAESFNHKVMEQFIWTNTAQRVIQKLGCTGKS